MFSDLEKLEGLRLPQDPDLWPGEIFHCDCPVCQKTKIARRMIDEDETSYEYQLWLGLHNTYTLLTHQKKISGMVRHEYLPKKVTRVIREAFENIGLAEQIIEARLDVSDDPDLV